MSAQERRQGISARNQLNGTVIETTRGATTAPLRLDIDGAIVTSAITNAAVDELKLAVGSRPKRWRGPAMS